MTVSLEQTEHKVMNQVAVRLTRVSDITPSLAIASIEARCQMARTAPLDDPDAWLAIATIAAKQAVIATQLEDAAR